MTIVEIQDGSFGPKLIQQDFDTALQVSLYSENCLSHSMQLIDIINSILAYLCYDSPVRKRMKVLRHMCCFSECLMATALVPALDHMVLTLHPVISHRHNVN